MNGLTIQYIFGGVLVILFLALLYRSEFARTVFLQSFKEPKKDEWVVEFYENPDNIKVLDDDEYENLMRVGDSLHDSQRRQEEVKP